MDKRKNKMNVFQLTIITAINMMGSGIIMLPAKLARVGTMSILSWLVTVLGSMALAYSFAQCGMYSNKTGGMGGYAKKEYLLKSMDPALIEIMAGIKKAFDPKNILNPHKIFQE